MDAGEVPSCVFAFRPGYERRTVWSLPISLRKRPGGSLELGMSALRMMSFIAKWRLARALDCLQTSPWWPLGSVVSPHWRWCGEQRFRPRRRPIATRTASLLSPKPQEAIGAVKSQSPAWGAETASNLAWPSGSLFENQTIVLSIAIKVAVTI